MKNQPDPRDSWRVAITTAIALGALALCWVGVSWALRPGLFPYLDEITNPTRFLGAPASLTLHLFPSSMYNDRPVGFAFIGLLYHFFGFDYRSQVLFLLAVHCANCVLGFALLRKLGASVPLALAGIALFGSLATTAFTVTYLGAAFDVLCLFFLLASTLTLLSGHEIWSALLFVAALRSKEFAIVAPLMLALLVGFRRLWPHFLVLLVFGARYLFLLPGYHPPPGNPYRMDLHAGPAAQSLAYYAGLIFGAEGSRWFSPLVVLPALGAILAWSIHRRQPGAAFGIVAFVLTILPVCFLPQMRSPIYVYAPQLFLIVALCLLAQNAIGKRWALGAALAILCLAGCAWFRQSSYFVDRMSWTLDVRRISQRTARDIAAQVPPLAAGTRVYVAHSLDVTPWLFAAGPCSYLQLVNRERSIECLIDQPSDQLRELYARDAGSKYWLEYRSDGSAALKPAGAAIK